jgi:multidrug efflux pump
MWISKISIKRPVLATVASILLVLLGLVCVLRLSVREYPDIDPPFVSITSIYSGASAETMESSVTEPLEEELTTIQGVKSMTSSSKEQVSSIIIEFELSRDIELAAQDVRDKVARARAKLPVDVEDPLVEKQSANEQAIMWIALHGKQYSGLQLTDFADKHIKDTLQRVNGVGRIIIGGERKYAMRIWLDPQKMLAREVDAADIEKALADKNVDLPAGRIESVNREFSIKTNADINDPRLFEALVIKTVGGIPVYLRDVGRVELGAKNYRSLVRFNQEPAVGIGVVKQSKANTLEVAKGVKETLETIRPLLLPGMKMESAFDQSLFIARSIKEVQESLFFFSFSEAFVLPLFRPFQYPFRLLVRLRRCTFSTLVLIPLPCWR